MMVHYLLCWRTHLLTSMKSISLNFQFPIKIAFYDYPQNEFEDSTWFRRNLRTKRKKRMQSGFTVTGCVLVSGFAQAQCSLRRLTNSCRFLGYIRALYDLQHIVFYATRLCLTKYHRSIVYQLGTEFNIIISSDPRIHMENLQFVYLNMQIFR